MTAKPVVLVCGNILGDVAGTPSHVVRDTYISALTDAARASALLLPVIGDAFDWADLFRRIDGVLLTGSASMVNPRLYGRACEVPETDLCNARDATSFALLRAALEADLPLFGICRGFQDLNVFCGGTLHQNAQNLPGKRDHRAKDTVPLLESYRTVVHPMRAQKGGLFERWSLPAEFPVNSLHTQGTDKPGKGLHIEAVSDDGVIEAMSMPDKRFVLAVQWHPEGTYDTNPPDFRLFEEFGKALRGAAGV